MTVEVESITSANEQMCLMTSHKNVTKNEVKSLHLRAPNGEATIMKVGKPVLKITDLESPKLLLDLLPESGLRDLITGIMMGQGELESDSRPKWAIRSANEFYRCCFDFPRSKQAKSENYRLGFMFGLINHLAPKVSAPAQFAPFLTVLDRGELSKLVHSSMDSTPAPEASDFYAGLADGLKRKELSPTGPFLIYLLLALAWREISSLKNTTEIHAWIEGIIGANLTETRERIGKICKKAGLPLSDKGGRPRGKPRKPSAS